MPIVDVVVVSFNSRDELHDCVAGLAALDDVNVIVVDNDSDDGSLDVLDGLRVQTRRLDRNEGFAYGCNVGWRLGEAPYVLFLNPDATLDEGSLRRLVAVLDEHPDVGVVAPRHVGTDGSLLFSQRRFQRLASLWAHALFLHRLFPSARWTNELVLDPDAYKRQTAPEWAVGACLLVRRPVLERIGGWDERFFMYCEDDDLCRRVWGSGYRVLYDPDAVCVHDGGASAPRTALLPVAAQSQLLYAQKHYGRLAALLFRTGIAVRGATHLLVSRGGLRARIGHARAISAVIRQTPGGAA